MNFSVHILTGPYSHQSNLSALLFCQASIDQGHQIKRVFFSGDGVYIGTVLGIPPQDEIDLYAQWQALARNHHIDLVVCVSARLRRGIINQSEASRYEKSAYNLPPEFIISGLGQLVEAGLESDRLITFGA
jgi:tRNA 2-thiouridine synthesizing protein D